jgi:hypothetical protein
MGMAGEVRTSRKGLAVAIVALGASLLVGGCFSVGRPFPVESVGAIQRNQTNQEEIRRVFGNPWRTGIEDGQATWTYAHYRRSLLGQTKTRDLIVRFNAAGVVTSYSFSSTYAEDAERSRQGAPF